MKKHFLTLMLMALLPLAAFAENYSAWTVTLSEATSVYTGTEKNVAVTLTKEGEAPVTITNGTDGWVLTWDATPLRDVHNYTLTVTNSGTHTAPTANTANYSITQADNSINGLTLAGWTYGAAANTPSCTPAFGAAVYTYSTAADGEYGTYADKVADQAGTYYVKASVAATTNYKAATSDPVEFTIAKKNLKAKAKAFTAAQSIFGVFEQNTVVAIEYDGFVYGEDADDLTTKPVAFINTAVNANDNTVTIGTKKYIKAGNYPEALEVTGGIAANYEIICLNNDLNISKAKIKVDLKNKPENAVFGSAAAAKTEWEIAWGAGAFDYLTFKRQTGATTYTAVETLDDLEAVVATRKTTDPAATYFKSAVKMTRADESTDVGEYLLALSGVEGTDNTVIEEQTNSTNLKFKITAAVLTIKASNKWKVYGTADPTEADGSWAFTAKAGAAAYNLSADQVAAIKAGLTRAEGETAGDYKISFSADLKANELFAGNYTITWTDGWLTIEKADLTITAKPQTLYKGNKVDKLVQTEYRVEGIVTNADLSIADAEEVSLAFGTEDVAIEGLEQTSVPVSAVEGHVGELTDAGDYLYGIKVVLANAEALAKNYNITLVNGALTVVSLDAAIVLNFAADNTEALETANGKEILATFTAKELQIGEWYAMVLPFEVDPLKMAKAFDRYVIFNELNTFATTDGNFKFTLRLEPIPAGTPFLIKFAPKTGDAEDAVVNLATDFTPATYGAVTISKNITPVETDYVIFDGTYQTGKVLQGLKDDNGGEKVWWLADKTYANGAGWKKPKSNPHTLNPMEAYLTAEGKTWTSYSPVITVEDFDGQVTSIKTLTSDKVNNLNVMTDGWYTVGGMKLQGAPTQKGIYIQNGKKVVVK